MRITGMRDGEGGAEVGGVDVEVGTALGLQALDRIAQELHRQDDIARRCAGCRTGHAKAQAAHEAQRQLVQRRRA
jgi:hypothetical protein